MCLTFASTVGCYISLSEDYERDVLDSAQTQTLRTELDENCSEINKGMIHPDCVGDWWYNELHDFCEYRCNISEDY